MSSLLDLIFRDPYSNYRFVIEVGGLIQVAFTECEGLQSEIEVEEWQEGGRNNFVHRFPGPVKPSPNLVLKRGIALPDLWIWYKSVTLGKIARLPLTITLRANVGTFAEHMAMDIRWTVLDALPVKWKGPSFRTDSTDVAFEWIELIHKGIDRIS